MARVLKWQQKLVLGLAALLLSVTSGLGLGPRDSATASRSSSSRVAIVGKSGVELIAHKPYLRLVHASTIPVSLPLATGAYVAMASAASAAAPPDATATAAPDADAAASCGGGGGTTCINSCGGTHRCHTIICSDAECVTCENGTCAQEGVCC